MVGRQIKPRYYNNLPKEPHRIPGLAPAVRLQVGMRGSMDTEPSTSFEPRIGRSVSQHHTAPLLGVSRRTIDDRIREALFTSFAAPAVGNEC